MQSVPDASPVGQLCVLLQHQSGNNERRPRAKAELSQRNEMEMEATNEYRIWKAGMEDLPKILQLQYLAYQNQAALFSNRNIPPLTQTLDEVIEEYHKGIILKMVNEDGMAIGSIRAWEMEGTVHIGKLMVHPDYWHHGFGTKLLNEIELLFPRKRYELFTSTRSVDNIRLYQRLGYREFDRKRVDEELEFVYMEK